MRAGAHLRLASLVLACTIAVSGCGGGAVAVRSNFSGPAPGAPAVSARSAAPAAAPAPRAASSGHAAPGLTVAGGGNLALAIVLTLMIVDGVNWVGHKLKQAFGVDETPPSGEGAAPTDLTAH